MIINHGVSHEWGKQLDLNFHPWSERAGMELLLVAEHLGLVLRRPPGLGPARLQRVQHREGGLGVPVPRVGHPAARLHLVAVQSPVLQLLLNSNIIIHHFLLSSECLVSQVFCIDNPQTSDIVKVFD